MDLLELSRCRDSLSLDHPYVKRYDSSLELGDVFYICSEPIKKPDGSVCSSDDVWIDVDSDVHRRPCYVAPQRSLEHLLLGNYLEEDDLWNIGHIPSEGPSWMNSAESLKKKLTARLAKIYLEDIVHCSKFAQDDIQRINNHRSLRVSRASRCIRKTFGAAYWCIELCLSIHSSLLQTLSGPLLSIYTEGLSELWHRHKLNGFVGRLNSLTCDRGTISRFPYKKFIHRVTNHSDDGTILSLQSGTSPLQRHTLGSHARTIGAPALGLGSLYSPFYLFGGPSSSNSNLAGVTGAGSRSRLSGSSDFFSSLSNFPCGPPPTLVLVSYPNATGVINSRRLGRLVKYLAEVARISFEPPDERNCEAVGRRVRMITRRVITLLEEPRCGPVYLVGFGVGCLLALIACMHLHQALLPSNPNMQGGTSVLTHYQRNQPFVHPKTLNQTSTNPANASRLR